MEIRELIRRAKEAPDYFPRRKLTEESKILLDYWGKDDQLDVSMEECAELIQAISKAKRYGIGNPHNYWNLAEEIGDVTIIIEHLKTIFDIPQEDINKCIHVKINRAHDRIRKDKEAKEKKK